MPIFPVPPSGSAPSPAVKSGAQRYLSGESATVYDSPKTIRAVKKFKAPTAFPADPNAGQWDPETGPGTKTLREDIGAYGLT